MSEFKKEFREKLLAPKSTGGRFLNMGLTVMAAVVCCYSTYLIKFIVCANSACDTLKITSIYVNVFSELALLYAAICLVLAYFLFSKPDLESIYSDCLMIVSLLGAMFVGFTPFVVSNEVGSIS